MNQLTGNYYFKETWFGLVLYVEWEDTVFCPITNDFSPPRKVFRKAKPEDIKKIGL